MADYDESQQRIDAQIKEAEGLLRQADEARASRDRLFEQVGITFQDVVNFMNSDQIPEDIREKMRDQEARYEAELAQEQERLAVQSGSAKRQPMEPGRMV